MLHFDELNTVGESMDKTATGFNTFLEACDICVDCYDQMETEILDRFPDGIPDEIAKGAIFRFGFLYGLAVGRTEIRIISSN